MKPNNLIFSSQPMMGLVSVGKKVFDGYIVGLLS